MSDNVIDFGATSFHIQQERYSRKKDECQHKNLELDDKGGIVTCIDCKVQVSAYWAIKMLVTEWHGHAKKIAHQVAELNADKAANLHLVAARKVEAVWRRPSMVPCCPHCGRGILATDGLGATQMSKKIELRRREGEANVPKS
jgi:hypothetical protein